MFLRGAASPPPYISLAAPVFSYEFSPHDLESDESLRDLGLRVVRGAVQAKECGNWYRILVDSCSTRPDAVWDLLSNAHSRKSAWHIPNCHGVGVLGPASLSLCWEGTPCNGLVSSAVLIGPRLRISSQRSGRQFAAGEDAKEQTWHTDVDKLPGTLPSKGELPGHLSMMLVVSDKYHLEVHLGSHLGEHDALRVETFEFQRGDMVLFACTLRHRGFAALPGGGGGKKVVLFRFLTPE